MSAFRLIRRGHAPQGAWFEAFGARQIAGERTLVLKQLTDRREGLAERLFDALKPWRGTALPVPEVFKSPEGTWLGTDATEGEPLRWLMGTLARANGFIAPNEGLALIARAAKLLDGLHQATLFHGDVSPSSVWVSESGEVSLHDVGVAHALGAQGDLGPYRSEMQYVSPEQLRGEVAPSGDVFRLGLWLYELSMGRPLWPGPTPVHVCHAAASFEGLARETVKHVPEPWHSLLVAMLDPRPSNRPGMNAVSKLLQETLAKGQSTAQADVAKLFARAAPGRAPLFTPQGATQELQLQSLSPVPHSSPSMTPTMTPPPGAVFAKIATRKMTREELAVARTGNTAPGTEALSPDVRAVMQLISKGSLTRQQFDLAQTVATAENRSLVTVLVEQGADEDLLVSALSEATRTTSIARKRVLEAQPGAEALALIPLALSRSARALPLGFRGNQLLVAMVDPLDTTALDALKAATEGKSLLTFRTGEATLREARPKHYPDATELELDPGAGFHTPSAYTGGGMDALDLLSSTPRSSGSGMFARPSEAVDLVGRTTDLLLRLAGARGGQGAQLVKLSTDLAQHARLDAEQVELARAAASAMVAAALNANRQPWDVPKLLEFQDTMGFGSPAEPFVEGLHGFPARMPEAQVVKMVVVAFAFAAHANDAKPTGPRRQGALEGFRARVQLAAPLYEALSSALV